MDLLYFWNPGITASFSGVKYINQRIFSERENTKKKPGCSRKAVYVLRYQTEGINGKATTLEGK